MSDWQKGDLALCVHTWEERCLITLTAPDSGSINCVQSVRSYPDGVYLELSKWPGHEWRASYFRKISPPKADEFDREVIEQMNGTPVGEPV